MDKKDLKEVVCLKRLTKEQLIDSYLHLKDEIRKLNTQLSDNENKFKHITESNKKLEEKMQQEIYNMWKNHINVDYLNHYLKEWINEHVDIDLEGEYDGDNSYTITGTLLIDKKPIKSAEGWFRI